MPMDPISFWIQASVFWAKVLRQQNEAYYRVLGAMVATLPHPSAKELSEAAAAQAAPDAASVVLMPAVAKARAKAKPMDTAPLPPALSPSAATA